MVREIEYRDGVKTVTLVNYVTGERNVVSGPERRNAKPGSGGYWLQSTSCGVPRQQVAKAKRLDATMGVSIDYDEKGRACFKTKSEYLKWSKAHHNVNHDAGYREFAPGHFDYK